MPNAGQTDPRVRFTAQTGGATFFFTPKEAVFSFVKRKKGVVLRLAFPGANAKARIEGQTRGPSKVNYMLGNDPSKWRTGLPTYQEVVYRELWPGIDLAISGAGGALKYEFRLDPGANASDIRLAYRGADKLSLGRAGELLIETPLGRLRDDRPRSYQVIEGTRVAVESRFVLDRRTSAYGFAVGPRDRRHPLIIDPGLVYSTFLGGSAGDFGWAVAIDRDGNAYATGHTFSANFPTTAGTFQPTLHGAEAVFVTKLNTAGNGLAYSTYIGSGPAVNPVTWSESPNNPDCQITGPTNEQLLSCGGSDLPAGASLSVHLVATTAADKCGTYVNAASFAQGVVGGNARGSAVATIECGGPPPPQLRMTTTADDPSVNAGDQIGFTITLSNAPAAATASSVGILDSLPGGSGTGVNPVTWSESPDNPDCQLTGTAGSQRLNCSPKDLAAGESISVHVVASTASDKCGAYVNIAQTFYHNISGAISGAPEASATIECGAPPPPELTITKTADATSVNAGDQIGFTITLSNAAGAGTAFNAGIIDGLPGGGRGGDSGSFDIAVDAAGNAYVTGETNSSDFPTTAGAFQSTQPASCLRRCASAFVTKLNASGNALVYSSYLGGGGLVNEGIGIAVDGVGNAYVTGQTDALDFPTTSGAFRTTCAGGDAFVTKVNASGSALVYSSCLAAGARGFDVAVDAAGNAYVTGDTESTSFPTTAGAPQTTFGGGLKDAFVTKVNAVGSALVYSSYLGGSGVDSGPATGPSIAIDGEGSAYMTGQTLSSNFPTTAGAFQTTPGGPAPHIDGFVAKVNAAGSALAYSSYLGGSGGAAGLDVAVDASGSAYVAGGAGAGFPTRAGAFQTTYGGNQDAFVTKVNASGSALVYSSYLGGCQNDVGNGIAVDALGAVYVGGATASTTFPTTPGSFQPAFGGFQDAFVTKLDLAPVTQPFVPDCTQPPPTPGTIVVKKSTNPSGSSSVFQFSGDAAGTIGDGQTIVVSELAPGTYRSIEASRSGWRLTRLTCDDSDSTGDVNTRTATFRVAAGETVTCTFTNFMPAAGPPPGCGVLYSTYLGGSGNDGSNIVRNPDSTRVELGSTSVAVDAAGNAYVAGQTYSTDFPTIAGAFQVAPSGESDVFVTKLNATGSAAIYSTYLGGSRTETPLDIALDGSGGAYIAGSTSSPNFPTTPGAFRTTQSVGFVTKLSPSGNAPAYSSYFGGSVNAIGVGGDGSVYLTGAPGFGFMTTPGAFQTTVNGAFDAYVAKMGPSGSTLTYASYLGGSNTEVGRAIAVDSSGNAYVGGQTSSTDFPTTPGAFQPAFAGSFNDAFVTKVNAGGSALAYSSYLGGSGGTLESAEDIALGGDGSAYVIGSTNSTTFPTTPGVFQPAFGGGFNDAFVTKVNASGALTYSSYLGGSLTDGFLGDIAVDAAGNAYLTGETQSANFPTTPGASQPVGGGSFSDAFVTRVNGSGSALAYSSYLGGPLSDHGSGIALGPDGSAYVTGSTTGSFPTTGSAFQTGFGGGDYDAFVTKLRPIGCGEPEPETGTIVVRKTTDPNSDTSTSFAFTAGGGLSPTSFALRNGLSQTFSNVPVGSGYSISESATSGWDASASCSDGSPSGNIGLSAGETVTCTFTNTKRGSVTLRKTTDGVVNPSRDILFVLTGPGLPTAGVSRSTFGDQDGVLDFGTANLIAGQTYKICESPVPAGFTSFWKLDGVIVSPYNPDASKSPPEDLGTRCYDFSVSPGQGRAFAVDNSHPGGDPRTIGYWKNWNRCTGGNQAATAQKNGGAAAGFFLVEDLLPQTIGDFSITTCQQAVKLLSKQDQNGRSKSSDAAYELGAQLLAARFNLAAGAETCSAVQQAVLDGQTLLDLINFTGSGDYLGSKSKDPKRAQALALAATLDRYNNGNIC